MSNPAALPAFQQYQQQFCAHIRDPRQHARPPRVPAKRMRVYTEIVFNNLLSAVSACFPVARSVLGKRAWRKLVREFFTTHACRSPLFRQIPEEFLRYLDRLDPATCGLPIFLKSLAHYEWIELALAGAEVETGMQHVDADGDLIAGRPVLAPALALLSYDYPVQLISARYKPVAPLAQPVNLLVFRDAADEVRFIELNPVTARLLGILQAGVLTGRQVLEKIATEMAHPDPQAIVAFGRAILADLKGQGAILGITIKARS